MNCFIKKHVVHLAISYYLSATSLPNRTMHYHFLNFKFNSTQLILTHNGEDVAIRHNEAKLLALILSQPEHVFSKEEILEAIWQDKVVSEQAVFQNISQLRSLFGNDAIKTYSKRGYQWQLATTSNKAEQSEVPTQTLTTNQLNQKPKLRNYALIIIGLLLLVSGLLLISEQKTQPNDAMTLHRIAYIPFSSTLKLSLDDTTRLDFTVLNTYNSDDFLTSAELNYQHLATTNPVLLYGQLREYNSQFFLDFTLKGPFDQWQGQLSASSMQALQNKLITHLQKPFIYSLIEQAQPPEIKQAALTIAHQSDAHDHIVLLNLITSYIQLNELDKAMVMSNKLLQLSEKTHNPQQLGNAYLKQSEILTQNELSEASESKLTLALNEYRRIADFKRQADTLYAYSWLYHLRNDYPAIKKSLLTAAELAYQANDKARELDALTYLSVLASKHQQHEDKYQYLRQAEIKMQLYKLPIYYFAKVPFHYAIFASTDAEKEPHLKQVLEFTALTPEHWVAQAARQQLLDIYLKQKNLVKAAELVNEVILDNAENSYLKARLADAQIQPEHALEHAKRTFEQARLAGNMNLSLNAALFLLTRHSKTVTNHDYYRLYIKKHAPKYWLTRHQQTLNELHML